MAKDQWHNWGRHITLVVTLIFVCGITYSRIDVNTDDIADVEKEVKIVKEDIHRIELNAKDTHALAARAAEAMVSIDSKFSTIQTQLNVQATIQAVNSEKLKTLTKD